jgi:hypothetical protein
MAKAVLTVMGAAMLAACATPTVEASAGLEWPALSAAFNSLGDLHRVAAQFPNSMGMQRRRLGAAIEMGDAATALDAARRLAAAGAFLSPAGREPLGKLVGSEAMEPLAAAFESNRLPLMASSVHAVIPPAHRLIEGLVWDGRSRRLYGTSAVDRRLVVVGSGVAVPSATDFGSLLGATYDPKARRIWVASAVIEPTPKGVGLFSGVLSIDPADPSNGRRVVAPKDAVLGDVAVARDGTVYASDAMKGAVYRCRPGCSALAVLVPPGSLFSAQGIAVSRDQKRLYVADRRYGIAIIDRGSGRTWQLAGGEGMMLDGIDGLAAYKGDLIATQTAYAPQRIVRLRLSDDGSGVKRLDVLERAHPEWGEVTLAAVVGDALFYVANAQWERFGDGGAVKGGAPVPGTVIRTLLLR